MSLNDLKNPTPFGVQNELRLFAKKLDDASFETSKDGGIIESKFECGRFRARLFEREHDGKAYLKIVYKKDDAADDVENYRMDNLRSIEFNHNTNRILTSCETHGFTDWGIDTLDE